MPDRSLNWDTNLPNFMAITNGGGRRHQFMTSKGNLWLVIRHNGNLAFYSGENGDALPYRGDGGVAGQVTHDGAFSVFCDETDKVHVVWESWRGASSDGRSDKTVICYKMGVFTDAAQTAIAWSGHLELSSYDYWHCPDVVAHVHNGQIRAHVMWNYNWVGDNRHIVVYSRIVSNIGESVNYVHEVAGQNLGEVYGTTQHGKISIELRHNGSGKVPELVNGVRQPDIFFSYNGNQQFWFGRLNWTTGNTWTQPFANFVIDSGGGSITSAGGNYGALYEHHRWHKTLYDARDGRVVIVSWFVTSSYGDQTLRVYEAPVGGSFDVAKVFLPFPANNGNETMISGDATLDTNSDIILAGNTQWASKFGLARVSRPKGSLTRTYASMDDYATTYTDTQGVRANLLQYPQSECHVIWQHLQVPMYWRTNRTSQYVNLGAGGDFVRKARFIMKAGGYWEPAQPRAL